MRQPRHRALGTQRSISAPQGVVRTPRPRTTLACLFCREHPRHLPKLVPTVGLKHATCNSHTHTPEPQGTLSPRPSTGRAVENQQSTPLAAAMSTAKMGRRRRMGAIRPARVDVLSPCARSCWRQVQDGLALAEGHDPPAAPRAKREAESMIGRTENSAPLLSAQSGSPPGNHGRAPHVRWDPIMGTPPGWVRSASSLEPRRSFYSGDPHARTAGICGFPVPSTRMGCRRPDSGDTWTLVAIEAPACLSSSCGS
jgi:hypothetical protein